MSKRSEWIFTIIALIAGLWFFFSLGRLWPLAEVDLLASRDVLVRDARAFLVDRGFAMEGYRASVRLRVDETTLDYLETRLNHDRIQSLIKDRLTLVRYQVFFKKPGSPRMYTVAVHPRGPVLGWNSSWRDEAEGVSLTETEALALAREAVTSGLGIPFAVWAARGVQSRDLPARRRFTFTFERTIPAEPPLKEQLHVTIEGDVVAAAVRFLEPPEPARLAARAAEAPGEALQTAGFLCLGFAGLAAIAVFLIKLQRGSVRLRFAATIAILAFLCGLGTQFLQSAALFLEWDPLWPRWVSLLQSLMFRSAQNVQILLLALVLIAAGDALDRETDAGRGNSLRLLARGRILDPVVARDCGRGFLLGLICGGVLTLAGYLPLFWPDSHVSIQPRGFFFYALNASSPALATILFFFGIALIEETGYRFFGGTWLLSLTGRRWVAILVPALIYGLTHTNLTFLPPAEPFWARPLVMTLVGCVWGWGFLRFGALTVIISHFTADLFIFNWPGLASGDPLQTTVSALTIAFPLIPVLGLIRRRAGSPAPGLDT